jgi:hypothetical protein
MLPPTQNNKQFKKEIKVKGNNIGRIFRNLTNHLIVNNLNKNLLIKRF